MEALIHSTACVLAVDPGLSGAVCRLGGGKFDVLRDFKRPSDIARAIKYLSAGVSHAVIEFVCARPGQGVCSMFSFGKATGAAFGAFATSVPTLLVEEVTPQVWQKWYRVQLGIPRETDFDSRQVARKIFPNSAPQYLARVKDHNSGDAILIAAWKQSQLSRNTASMPGSIPAPPDNAPGVRVNL